MKKEFLKKVGLTESEFISKAVDNIDNWYSYWRLNWENSQEGVRYLLTPDGQWRLEVREKYKNNDKALIQINKLKPQADNLFGHYANYVPEQTVFPVNSETVNQKEVDLVNNLLESHLNSPHNNRQKKALLFNQIHRGYGAWYLTLDYENEASFKKVVKLHSCDNPDRMFFDWRVIRSQFSDGSDGNYSGYVSRLSKDHFQALYPNEKYPESFDVSWQSQIAQLGNWGSKKDIIVAKYNQRILVEKNLCELSNGQTLWEEVAEEVLKQNKKERRQINKQNKMMSLANPIVPQAQVPDLIRIVNKIPRKVSEVYVVTMIRDRILEVEQWYSHYLPAGIVLGKAHVGNVNNYSRVLTTWFGQHAKGAQDLCNYGVTTNANAMKNACFDEIWMGASTMGKNRVYFEALNDATNTSRVKLYDDAPGREKPIKVNSDQISPIYLQTAAQASTDIQEITGIHPAAMGADEKVRSGYAVGLNVSRSMTTNMDILTNNFDTIEQVGNIILSLFPTIYDSTQTVTVPEEDGGLKEIKINNPQMDLDGNQKVENDLRNVRYQVKISVGLPRDYQQQLENEQIMKFAQAYPDAAHMTVDLAGYSLPVRKAPQLGKRCENLVPPNILAQEKGEPPSPQPPNPQEQLAQQQIQLEQQKLQVEGQKNQVQMVKAQAELQGIHTRSAAETNKAHHDTVQQALKTTESVSDFEKKQLQEQNDHLKQAVQHLSNMLKGSVYDY